MIGSRIVMVEDLLRPQHLFLVLVIFVGAALIWWPWAKIFAKAGYSCWLGVMMLIPLVNIVMLFWFAVSEWPALRRGTPSLPPS